MVRWRYLAPFALLLGLGCDPPSSTVDTAELHGVFEDGGAQSSASASTSTARASASASAAPVVRARNPGEADCVEERGEPAPVGRIKGRPACRASEILEWRDPSGAPRYACLYTPSETEKRGPLPLVVFFHGSTLGLDDPTSLPKLTSLRSKMGSFDFTAESERKGFMMLAVQGRALAGSLGATFDTSHVSADNLDKVATDHFIDTIAARSVVDKARIYAVGMGKGGEMAATYAMLRADRVAAFAAYAPSPAPAAWQCPGPPPPALVFYRACDAVVPCDTVESWLRRREATRAETKSTRLGEANREEPSCAVRNKCSKKKGEAHHYRWPRGREQEMLRFLAGHALK